MKIEKSVTLFSIFLIFLVSCGPAIPDEVKEATTYIPEDIDFNLHVKPILSDRCFACHGPDQQNQKAGLRLDDEEYAKGELPENPGHYAIREGSLSKSQLISRILTQDPEAIMPPPESNLFLSDYEKAVLIEWIDQGAEYKPHWSFIKPTKRKLPEINQEEWPENPIDHYVLKQLEMKNWEPAKEADKETLLRRISLDLTGLPPTIKEIEDFQTDDSPEAYEKVVDRLLAAPHYGERMAADWMDLARFADTHGYTVDRYRDMSPWRDWVIKVFNENMAYNEFVTWQLAGDLLPEATDEQRLATGFNRNHQQNMEGGIVDEEFRVEYVADRTNTLGAAFMGITLECARCHDHKYDPISQKDYYQLYSFFNNVNEAGQISWDNAPAVPTLLMTDAETKEAIAFLEAKIGTKEKEIEKIDAQSEDTFHRWLESDRQKLTRQKILHKAIAYFPLDKIPFTNALNSREKGTMKQQHIRDVIIPNQVNGKERKALKLDGDAWLDLGEVGAFERSDPFSIAMWVNIPEDLTDGVIFHKGDGAALYNFRGYHVALKDNKVEVILARTMPNNAIVKYVEEIPREQWVHLAMTYDGSSKASGLNLYLNGELAATETKTDNLYKSILFGRNPEPGLQIGARWRGKGVGGTIVDEINVFKEALSPPEVLGLFDEKKLNDLSEKAIADLSVAERQGFRKYYLANVNKEYSYRFKELTAAHRQKNALVDTITEIMVMEEMAQPRQAYILERGQYSLYGEPVFSNTPNSILPWPTEFPRNRLGLAQWLTHPDHPLFARVTVNRLWQSIFGRGLVKTTEDFGNQGELPSHPELLDWLAVEFQENGWDQKALIKTMVMSATYRQASHIRPEIQSADPGNVFLARGPSSRLTGEMLRDNALAASGLLSPKIGGRSVKPYQPAGLWKVNSGAYTPDSGEKLYRRGLYTFWKRTIPYPGQSTFDIPSRSICTVKRQKTNTPLQALVMLNDPVFLEASRILAQKMLTEEEPKAGIEFAFRKLTGRNPATNEVELLLEMYQKEKARLSENPEKIQGWLKVGEKENNPGQDSISLAVNTLIASTIMNSDAFITKR